MAKNKPLYFDCVAGSEIKDSQGETLSVQGADISEFRQLNDNHGKSLYDQIGTIVESKKIFKEEDCDNERHKHYWNIIKAPYIYAKGYLFNNENHGNANAAAAILRNIHKADLPLKLRASVEGGVISRGLRDPSRLERTKIVGVALTFTPANKNTLVEPLDIEKSHFDEQKDLELIKSVMHLAKDESEIPSFRHIERNASANKIVNNIQRIQELAEAVGVKINVEMPKPEELVKRALQDKILNNMQKINELVKKFDPYKLTSDVKNKRWQTYNSTIGKLKGAADSSAATPLSQEKRVIQAGQDAKTPHKPEALRVVSGTDFKNKISDATGRNTNKKIYNTIDAHAQKAMQDPNHLKLIHKELTNRGIDSARVDELIGHIKNKMQAPQPSKIDDFIATHNDYIKNNPSIETPSIGDRKDHRQINFSNPEHAKAYREHMIGQGHNVSDINTIDRFKDVGGQKVKSGVDYQMIQPFKKSDELEKGIIKDGMKAARTIAFGATLAAGANHFANETKEHTAAVKPKVQEERTVASKPKESEEKIHYDEVKPMPKGYRRPTVQEHLEYAKKKKQEETEKSEENQEVKKALTAGFGGGSPMDSTGGQVFQSESIDLDKPTKGFKYITCPKCLKEQIYSKHQVRCRECNKNFPLETVASALKKQ